MKNNKLDDIFKRELQRLDDLSKVEPLSIDDLRRLETLTRSLKNYVQEEEEEDDGLSHLTPEQIEALATMEIDSKKPTKKKQTKKKKTSNKN